MIKAPAAVKDEIQLDMLDSTDLQAFNEWKATDSGGSFVNKFIRLSVGVRRRGFKKYSHWKIAARVAWYFDLQLGPENSRRHAFKVNNNWISYMARFAVERCEELKDFFEFRELGKRSLDKVVVVHTNKPEEVAALRGNEYRQVEIREELHR